MSIVEKLTEGIVRRDLSQESSALVSKWEKTGLLEGLGGDHLRNGMASLLENQAKELLREGSSMSSGDVEGFAAVAFPLVRRVFGNLIANDLVSVQPMSLPSGLIFFLDFVVSGDLGAGKDSGDGSARLGYHAADRSLYGGNVVGAELTGGVDLGNQFADKGPYNLNNGYASPTGSNARTFAQRSAPDVLRPLVSGTVGDTTKTTNDLSGRGKHTLDELIQFDPDLLALSGTANVFVFEAVLTGLTASGDTLNKQDLIAIQVSGVDGGRGIFDGTDDSVPAHLVRRLTRYGSGSQNGALNDQASEAVIMVAASFDGAASAVQLSESVGGVSAGSLGTSETFTWEYPIDDTFNAGGAIGSVVGASPWGLENNTQIPEIDIKVDSVAVTAITKKLKAKWTPELGQDLNAYHNLDAEVELTQILSEQIALEIDREILEDLVRGATTVRYWSRAPGKFVNRETGVEVGADTVAPDFTGNVSEWYETLIETINDVSAQIHRKTLRGAANFVVCSPEVANILEFTAGFRANVTVDSDRGDAGSVKVGSLSKKFDIYVDPYFLRGLILVGRRGSSFLESGYVYAPYVPLQTTPTIFGVEDFVPRKGVMTRYAKKMVRPDMYGIVFVQDMMVG